eukprot:SAG31_NODE_1727_length_7429_cov_4.342701_4_plen_255_part_00
MRRPPVPPPPLLLWAALLGLAQAARCHTSVGDAQWLCRDGGSTIADSLRSVGLGDDSDSSGSELHELLHENGLRTATDLRLLAADGVEAAELMEQLRGGGISIGDRSKVRLLLGGGERSVSCGTESPRSVTPVTGSADAGGWHSSRQLQGASGGMSADTIAIVLSVLVGAAGYLVQVSCRWPLAAGSPHESLVLITRPIAGVHGPAGRAQLSSAGPGAAHTRAGAAAGARADAGADRADGPGGGRLLWADPGVA